MNKARNVHYVPGTNFIVDGFRIPPPLGYGASAEADEASKTGEAGEADEAGAVTKAGAVNKALVRLP